LNKNKDKDDSPQVYEDHGGRKLKEQKFDKMFSTEFPDIKQNTKFLKGDTKIIEIIENELKL